MKSLAVLITCHNRIEHTIKCLHSLRECYSINNVFVDVFLVDDQSTDDTKSIVKNTFPDVNVIEGDGNLFWSRGMHLAWITAIKLKDYDFFLWLNNDVQLLKYSIIELINVSFKSPNAIICGSTYSNETNKITYGGRLKRSELLIPNGLTQECDQINGNVVLVPKSVFKVIGTIDPLFPHAIGDIDYSLRAKNRNIKSYVSPNYLGICEANKTLPKWCLSEIPLFHRLAILYSPLGYSHPYYQFIFEIRHYNFIFAIFHFITIHIRVFVPSLWKNH